MIRQLRCQKHRPAARKDGINVPIILMLHEPWVSSLADFNRLRLPPTPLPLDIVKAQPITTLKADFLCLWWGTAASCSLKVVASLPSFSKSLKQTESLELDPAKDQGHNEDSSLWAMPHNQNRWRMGPWCLVCICPWTQPNLGTWALNDLQRMEIESWTVQPFVYNVLYISFVTYIDIQTYIYIRIHNTYACQTYLEWAGQMFTTVLMRTASQNVERTPCNSDSSPPQVFKTACNCLRCILVHTCAYIAFNACCFADAADATHCIPPKGRHIEAAWDQLSSSCDHRKDHQQAFHGHGGNCTVSDVSDPPRLKWAFFPQFCDVKLAAAWWFGADGTSLLWTE